MILTNGSRRRMWKVHPWMSLRSWGGNGCNCWALPFSRTCSSLQYMGHLNLLDNILSHVTCRPSLAFPQPRHCRLPLRTSWFSIWGVSSHLDNTGAWEARALIKVGVLPMGQTRRAEAKWGGTTVGKGWYEVWGNGAEEVRRLTGFFPSLWGDLRDQEWKEDSCGVRGNGRGNCERQTRPWKLVFPLSISFLQSFLNPFPIPFLSQMLSLSLLPPCSSFFFSFFFVFSSPFFHHSY